MNQQEKRQLRLRLFFFSSRRRHTRFDCDWSSDVCSSDLKQRVLEALGRAGLWTNDGPIVAFGPTSAMPHYEPHPGADRRLAAGDVVLLDVWAGPGEGSGFAHQTWMGVAGRSPDAGVRPGGGVGGGGG